MTLDLQMNKDRIKAWIFVSIQLFCIVYVMFSASPVARYPFLVALQFAGIAIGIWALIAMRPNNLNISPLVKQGAFLVTTGPYRFVRHPMYLAVLLFIWSLIIDDFTPLRFTVGIILAIDLIVKLLFEENLLKKHFAAYEDYMKETKRLVPFVF
ncbi:MAG TPA: isoprenylcysteine carboxylmethyltransferase family protein [Syntrophales bacterium]|nr:isoprenylcysteine carboxylmethyltransferase family protein [Syntrophales bacterium]